MRLTYKNPLYFYILAMIDMKMKQGNLQIQMKFISKFQQHFFCRNGKADPKIQTELQNKTHKNPT